jgi:hypothetical protein
MVEDWRCNECKWAFVAAKKHYYLQRQVGYDLRKLQVHFDYMASTGNKTRYSDLTLQEKIRNLNVLCHYNKVHKLKRNFKNSKSITSSLEKMNRPISSSPKMLKSTSRKVWSKPYLD